MPKAPSDQLLPQLLAKRAVESADVDCVIDLTEGSRTTYASLHTSALKWASALASIGVGPGDHVATILQSGALPLKVWVGLGWIKAVNVPVNGEYYGDMLASVLSDAEVRAVVVQHEWVDSVLGVLDQCPTIDTVVVIGSARPIERQQGTVRVCSAEPILAAAEAHPLTEGPEPHDIAAILFTSGTSGRSKGVLIPWQHCYEAAIWSVPSERLKPGDVTYLPFPCHHLSYLGPAYGMFLLGGAVVTRHRFSTSSYWDDVREHGCVYGPLLGTMANLLAARPALPNDLDNPMRFGAMVPVIDDVRAFEERFGLQIGTLFGMTELSVPLRSPNWAVTLADGVASCGRERPGVTARIVDEHDWPVPDGEVGELVLRFDDPWAMSVGYWHNAEATAEAWRNGWFHTGDAMLRTPDGDFFHRDRIKDVIRRRGENISSAEVETMLVAHPAVSEVAAVAVPSPLGEDDVKVVVVVAHGQSVTAAELAEFAEKTLPRFMRPRYVELVPELPKTPTLKVKKAVLRAVGISAGTFDLNAGAPDRSTVPVSNEVSS